MLAVGPLQVTGASAPRLRDFVFAWAATTALGGLVEVVQYFVGRDAELQDAIRDGMGAAAFLLAAAAVRSSPWRRLAGGAYAARAACAILAVMLMGAASAQFARVSLAYAQRDRDMPRVLAFGAPWRATFVVTKLASLEVGPPSAGWNDAPAGPVGHLRLRPVEYTGIAIEEPFPDWTPYDRLAFEAYNPGSKPVDLTLRIDDEVHDMRTKDRFNGTITLAPGVSRIGVDLHDVRTAPEEREMDMSRIRRVVLFAYRPAAAFDLELSDFVLRKEPAR